MPTIQTLGHPSKRTTFTYAGNIAQGVTVQFTSGTVMASAGCIAKILQTFSGQTIPGGFSMTSPTPGGLGEWVLGNIEGLTPRHASFIAAILVQEAEVTSGLDGNTVYLTFPQRLSS